MSVGPQSCPTVNAMRVGVVILPQFSAAETAARWKSLEDRGFDAGYTYDHLAWRMLAEEPWYATMPTLCLAATATSRLKLGTWVASPNFRHPVPFAKELMTLDEISGGRMVGVFGAGGIGWDSAVLGRDDLPPRQRVDRLTEFVTLTDELLREGETSWQGEWYTAVRARMYPAGSRERIPLVVAGNGPRSVALAARYDGWATIGNHLAEEADAWWNHLTDLVHRFDDVAGTGQLRRMLNPEMLPGYVGDDPGSVLDAAGRAEELGFTDLVINWPRREGIYAGDDRILDTVAERLVDGELRL
jgi:alkanesulfonate monooxygenase SsuD/methylene tetrahydromethanopterin reductase-like flavin-dependent oxidoreductase (luciferase family)